MAEASELQPNVSDLADIAGIGVEDMDQECRECDLSGFAHLCDPWELIGHHLRLKDADISAIKENYDSAEMRRLKVLKTWWDTNLKPTYKVLVEAFLRCGKIQQALNICKTVKRLYSEGSRPNASQVGPGEHIQVSTEQMSCRSVGTTAVQSSLKESIRDLELKFSDVQKQFMGVDGLTLDSLKQCVATLPSFKSSTPSRLFHSVSVYEFFLYLKNYCNIQSHDILDDLIEMLGDDETKKKMSHFKIEYQAFQRSVKLKDFIGIYEGLITSPPTDHYKELEMKLGENWQERTLEDLEKLRHKISLEYWLLKNVEDGCNSSSVENTQHYQAYKAALEGAITLPLRYMKFLFFGSPRSGKSTMRQRLLREIINLVILGQPSVSTGVAEVYEVIIKKMTSETAAIAGSQWHSLKKSKSIKRGATKEDDVGVDIKYLTQIFYHLISKTAASTPSPTSEAILQLNDSEASNGSGDPTPHDDEDVSIPDEPSPTQPKAKHEASVEMADIDKAFDELASILQSDSPKELYHLLKALTLINISDVGGQPEFLDVIPALTVGAALYLLFFRLDQEVHERYPVKFLSPGSTTERTLTSSYCIEEMLHQALASIACFSGHSSEENAYSAPSRAILVGTYKDQVTASDIAIKEKEIQEKFTSAEVYKDLLLTTKQGKPFFTVDNMNGTDESEMSEIRSNIENIVKAFFEEVPIPASWLMFRVMLQLLKKPIVTLSQCEEIARRLSMPTPVQEALWFFHHQVGSLLYYPDIPSMRGTVICTPQVIFDSISTVIIDNFQYSNYQVPRKAVEQFQQTGLFSLTDISEKTKEHRSSHLSSNQLVDVLKHQGILAEVKHDEEDGTSEPAESKFIIPAVLEHASEEELKQSPSLEASPLMIRFEGGFVPFGVFSASIARLIAHADSMSPKWKLCREQVRKNKVKFLIAKAFIATLISRPRYLEIQVEQHSRAKSKYPLQDICVTVRQEVTTTLEAVISKMKYKPIYIVSHERPFDVTVAFPCSLEESHSDHLMKIDKDEDELCCECLRESFQVELESKHYYWFNQIKLPSQSKAASMCKSNVTSNISDYYKGEVKNRHMNRIEWMEGEEEKEVEIYDEAACMWERIGQTLGFQEGTLTSINRNCHDDRGRVIKVFGHWMTDASNLPNNKKYPKTWPALVRLLKKSHLSDLSEKLNRALLADVSTLRNNL